MNLLSVGSSLCYSAVLSVSSSGWRMETEAGAVGNDVWFNLPHVKSGMGKSAEFCRESPWREKLKVAGIFLICQDFFSSGNPQVLMFLSSLTHTCAHMLLHVIPSRTDCESPFECQTEFSGLGVTTAPG